MINTNDINMKKENGKKNIKESYNYNLTKSYKKPKSKISIFSVKLNNLNQKRKGKEKILNTTKKYSSKQQIMTEKKEKIPKASNKNQITKKINYNKSNEINKINKSINNINNTTITYHNNKIHEQKNKSNNFIKQKILSSKVKGIKNKYLTKSLSISSPPIINDKEEVDDVTSYELPPSELKTPNTISEDSFISTNKEKKEKKLKYTDIIKKKIKEIQEKREEGKNIRVNIKTSSIYNNKEEKNLFKSLNSSRKIIKNNSKNKKLSNSNNFHSTKNINTKLRSNNKNFIAFIPIIQNNIKVKKNQNLDIDENNNENNDENGKKHYRSLSRRKIEDKNKSNQELSKNSSNHSIKFNLNQKLAKLKKNKNKLIKINAKIPINNIKMKINDNNYKKDSKIILNNIDIKTEKNIKNKKKQNEKIMFKINTKLAKNLDITNTSLKNKKLIKIYKSQDITNDSNIQNNTEIYNFKKKSRIITENKKLALNIDNSNDTVNNNYYNKLTKNMSGNNIIYAPKRGINKQKSYEKNIYNNMSYNPQKMKEIFKKKNSLKYNNKKENQLEMEYFIEKNNSFCGNLNGLEQLLIEKENNFNSPRINSTKKIPEIKFNIINSENNNSYSLGNDDTNYINKTSEKIILDNNNIFIPNRLTTTEKINYNKYFQSQDFSNSLNSGININTDFNNYNINNLYNISNIFNRRTFINKMNIYNPNYNFSIMSPFNNNINQTNLINLFNNNYLNFNTIQGRPTSFINYTNYNINEPLYQNKSENKKKYPSINIEDIIILQEKLKNVILALNKTHIASNECFEFLNFYYNCSIYCQLEKSFTNPLESNVVRISINIILISIIICYDYSFETEIMNQLYKALIDLIKLNYKNLIIIYEHIFTKISNESKNNIWVKRLSNIINSYKKDESNKLNNNISKISQLNYNINIIFQNLILILKNFVTIRQDYFLNFMNNISEKNYSQINIFFREYILRTNNINGSILASVLLNSDKKNWVPIPNPYVRTKNSKNFSLVLDLDETLAHFKEKNEGEGNGVLRIRPGINEFLEEVGKYYELIIFTTATQDYADTLIDAIEEDKIYFEHRFYRNHATIINNDFVKDLRRIGRPLDKIIIIDNMPQNFRLQKENGIMIKPFWGEDNYDTVLLDLIPILVNIAKDGGDVRKGLVKYKEDILKKISSSISKEII